MTGGKKGAILITSLWILAILSILAIGIGFRISIEARLSKYYSDRLKALYLAKAGVVNMLDRMAKKSETIPYDSLYECGLAFSDEEKEDPVKMKAIFNAMLGEGFFNIAYKEDLATYQGMMDEERKVNINLADSPLLENLLGSENGAVAVAIVNWRTPGQAANVGEKAGTSEHRYPVKHAPFAAIEELLSVDGMTPELFNEIKDYVTVYGKGQININTVSKKVLSALIVTYGGADKVAADTYADRIIAFRTDANGKQATKDSGVFRTDVNIEAILPELSTKASDLKKYLTIKSDNFRIESTGTIAKSRVEKKIVCIVNKDTWQNYKFAYYHEY